MKIFTLRKFRMSENTTTWWESMTDKRKTKEIGRNPKIFQNQWSQSKITNNYNSKILNHSIKTLEVSIIQPYTVSQSLKKASYKLKQIKLPKLRCTTKRPMITLFF